MVGAASFTDINYNISSKSQIIFDHDDVIIDPSDLVLGQNSSIVFDIKKFDLKTESLVDYGFALLPLVHSLQNRNFLISGQYQLQVFRGAVHPDILKIAISEDQEVKPRKELKRLYESSKILCDGSA